MIVLRSSTAIAVHRIPRFRAALRGVCITTMLLWLLGTSGVVVNATAGDDPRVVASAFPSRQRIQFDALRQTPHPAIVRVSAAESSAIAQGSGTFVGARGDYGLVITNWHVIRDASGMIVVSFPDGSRSAATVAKVDDVWDLAALLIWRPKVHPMSISTQAPDHGDLLSIAGYGSGEFRVVTGRCTQYVAPDANMPFEMVEVSVEARQGDSGGPILNERGELAGVLFGADGSTVGSYCGRVRLFLESVWPAIDYVDDLADAASGDKTLVAVNNPRHRSRWPSEAALQQNPVPPQSTFDVETDLRRDSSRIPVIAASPHSSTQPATQYDWQRIIGSTSLDQAKSILAGIGILALLLQFTRRLTGSRKSP